jgi:hypothetical protein
VFDIAGREVARPYEGELPTGPHDVSWTALTADGRPLAAGVYAYRLETTAGVLVKKLALLPWSNSRHQGWFDQRGEVTILPRPWGIWPGWRVLALPWMVHGWDFLTTTGRMEEQVMCMATRVLSASLTFGFLVALHPAVSWADRYADAVVAFSPVIKSGQPTAPHLGSTNSLGAPDYNGVTSCGSEATCTFVSLGDGGSITLRFVDNALTGSDGGDPDIWIYEVGPDVEDTFVEISTDATTWLSAGKVFASTSTIDIDAVEALSSIPIPVQPTSWGVIKARYWAVWLARGAGFDNASI